MKFDMEYLLILDSRTAKSYKIPIQDNFVQATDVAQIGIPENTDNEDGKMLIEHPLRILDHGFENTACMVSSITVMYGVFPPFDKLSTDIAVSDGFRGSIRFRDQPIEDLFREYVYEDVMHLLIWGSLPSLKQKQNIRITMSQAAVPPKTVIDVISAFP